MTAEPHLKAVPDPETGLLRFEMDAEGFRLFERLLARAEPKKTDNLATFSAVRDRVSGAFMAGAILMNWRQK